MLYEFAKKHCDVFRRSEERLNQIVPELTPKDPMDHSTTFNSTHWQDCGPHCTLCEKEVGFLNAFLFNQCPSCDKKRSVSLKGNQKRRIWDGNDWVRQIKISSMPG